MLLAPPRRDGKARAGRKKDLDATLPTAHGQAALAALGVRRRCRSPAPNGKSPKPGRDAISCPELAGQYVCILSNTAVREPNAASMVSWWLIFGNNSLTAGAGKPPRLPSMQLFTSLFSSLVSGPGHPPSESHGSGATHPKPSQQGARTQSLCTNPPQRPFTTLVIG